MDQASVQDDKLEFAEAMRDFRKMFPSIDDEIIEAVLRANNGAVDDTIDQLLVMSLDREDNAFAETLPKRIGDLESATPRVNVPPLAPVPEFSAISPPRPSAAAPVPPYSLADEKKRIKHVPAAVQPMPSLARSDKSTGRQKIYRPPLVGQLPPDFLRISSSADPWAESLPRSASRSSYSGRRSTVNYDYRQLEREQSYHEGPPPPYSVAVGRRYSERATSKTDRPHYRSPQHTYLGVFRTTTMPQQSPVHRNSDRNAPVADALKDAMAENEWKRRVAKDPELAQYLEDERIALMLQNEEFMRQLRNDSDFLAALERDAAEARRRQSPRKSNSNQGKSQRDHPSSSQFSNQSDPRLPTSSAQSHIDDLPDLTLVEPFPADPFPYTKTIPKDDVVERSFQDKLGVMGRASKRKFATMARRFIRKSKGAKGVLDNNESRTHALLLNSDEDSDDGKSAEANAGYNQTSDAEYNIGHQTDLKQGRFF